MILPNITEYDCGAPSREDPQRAGLPVECGRCPSHGRGIVVGGARRVRPPP